MREIILIKNGEIALKGLNRNTFENILIKNIKLKLSNMGQFKFTKAQSTIYIEPVSGAVNMYEVIEKLKQVFGIAGICRACYAMKDIEDIKKISTEYLKDELTLAKTFKVESKRADKKFALKSPEISSILGGHILHSFPHLTVDVHNPDVIVNVEIRDFGAYIHGLQIPGKGGMPVGSSGKGMLMISGGIDSPVAGYMMAKRGLELEAIHFVSPPYTSERAKLKVINLLKKISKYCGEISCHIIHFTQFQESIKNKCPEDLFTVIMRRYMVKISQTIANQNSCEALITGESLAQVASQTMSAIACTESVANMPIFRPLIGLDKTEIIKLSRDIGTYETSILPYEDCCTVFTPRHPKTKPTIKMLLAAESNLKDIESELMQKVFDTIEVITISE